MLSIFNILNNMDNRMSMTRSIKNLQSAAEYKQKVALEAIAEAERANEEAEKAIQLLTEAEAKVKAKTEKEASEVEILPDETSEQKIARLEKELADAIIIRELEEKFTAEKAAANNTKAVVVETNTTAKTQTPAPTAKVEAEKLNVTSAPKAEVAVEVYEPESPKTGAKGAATRRK